MRIVNILLALVAAVSAALAQPTHNSYVDLALPQADCILVITPDGPAGRLYLPGGQIELDAVEVQVGRSDYDHWGFCWFDEPIPDAAELLVAPVDDGDGIVLVDGLVPLDGPPGDDGWTRVDLAGLRGGGHSDGPVDFIPSVPGYLACYIDNRFSMAVRSPDIDGDLNVDLTDVVLFTQALGQYEPYADYRPDGVIDLSDIVIMAQAIHNQ